MIVLRNSFLLLKIFIKKIQLIEYVLQLYHFLPMDAGAGDPQVRNIRREHDLTLILG